MSRYGWRLLAALALALALPALAEDIELFIQDPSITGERPNVLIAIDNQSNWSSQGRREMLHAAVREVLLERPDLVDRVNLGLLNLGASPREARIIERIEPLTAERQQADSTLYARVAGIAPGASDDWWATSNSDYGMMLHEAYLYFSGRPASANNGPRDLAAIAPSGHYLPPEGGDCARNFVIFIGNGFPTNDHPSLARDALAALGGDTSVVGPLSPRQAEASWSDEWARFLASGAADVRVNTHVIDVFDAGSNRNQPFLRDRAAWQSVARQGRGDYYEVTDVDQLIDALTMTFDSILAVNSVFAASALPVSVNVRGTHLNQVYMGVFRPDADGLPRWMGNLKKYQLGLNQATGEVYLADADGRRADSAVTGFVHDRARSFWSHDSNFWDGFNPEVYRHSSDSPDGDVVEKGGVAQQLRNHWASRRLLSCGTACAGAPVPLADKGLDPELLEWLRGEDNIDSETSHNRLNNARASIHGDVLHSRPAVFNYRGDTDIVVFYGANDGTLRAVRGGNDLNGGRELWAFVAPEFFPRLENLYRNDPIESRTGKPYFMDGSLGRYHEANANGDITKAWLFASMRRGGRALYAFDVTDYEDPQILWRLDHNSDGFAELGQTWSEPKVIRTKANDGKPVLVFGAGYDPAFEDQLARSGSPSMGRGIFVVDAQTGTLLWSAGPEQGMTYSIPSEVAAISRQPQNRSAGITDRLYVGDTGGNVWRIDINSADTADWRVHRLASLGSDRKFLFPPDVVYDNAGGYDAILLGSGDREKPHDSSVANAFFMLKDRHPAESDRQQWDIADGLVTIELDDLYDATANLIQEGDDSVAEQAKLRVADGWVVHFATGEKTVGSALTLDGTTFFSTHQPQASAPGACVSNLGIARNYALSFRDATATREQDGVAGLTKEDRAAILPGGGLVPSPVAVLVEIDGQLREAVLRGTQVDSVSGQLINRRLRTYWYREID